MGSLEARLALDSSHVSQSFWHRVVLPASASSAHPHQQPQTSLAAVVYGCGVGAAQCVGVVACRSHGAASTGGETTAAAIAVLRSLAVVAADRGYQALSSLQENPCLSRLIREGSGVWYRFQLLSLIDKDEVLGFRLHLADELIDVALTCPNGSQVSYLSAMVL